MHLRQNKIDTNDDRERKSYGFWTLAFLLLQVIPEQTGLVGEVQVGVEPKTGAKSLLIY